MNWINIKEQLPTAGQLIIAARFIDGKEILRAIVDVKQDDSMVLHDVIKAGMKYGPSWFTHWSAQ